LKEKPPKIKETKESKKAKKKAAQEEKLRQKQQQKQSKENSSLIVQTTFNESPKAPIQISNSSQSSAEIQASPNPITRKKMPSEDFSYPERPNNEERIKYSKSTAFKIVLDNSASSLSEHGHEHDPDLDQTDPRITSPFNRDDVADNNFSVAFKNMTEDISLARYLNRFHRRSRSLKMNQQEQDFEDDFLQYLAMYEKGGDQSHSNRHDQNKRRVKSCSNLKGKQDKFFSVENLIRKNSGKNKTPKNLKKRTKSDFTVSLNFLSVDFNMNSRHLKFNKAKRKMFHL